MYGVEGRVEPYTLPLSMDLMILRVMSLGNPDFGMLDIPRLLSVSKTINVTLDGKQGNGNEKFENCFYVLNDENANGLAFSLMSSNRCIEFYAVAQKGAEVFIYDLGAKEPSRIGAGNMTTTFVGDWIEIAFALKNFILTIKVKMHFLEADAYIDYMKSKGDALDLKRFALMNQIEKMKFDLVGRIFSIGYFDKKDLVVFWYKSQFAEMNISDGNFYIRIESGTGEDPKCTAITLVDENGDYPNLDKYKRLSLMVRMSSNDDILTIRNVDLICESNSEEIAYSFDDGFNKIIFTANRRINDIEDNPPYEMFTAIEGFV